MPTDLEALGVAGAGTVWFPPAEPAPHPDGVTMIYVYDATGHGLTIPETAFDPALHSMTPPAAAPWQVRKV